MPLFRRSSFRTPRKPVRRRADSLPNLSRLDESLLSMDSMRLEAAPVSMRLGDHHISFEEGQWIVAGGRGASSREFARLQKQHLKALEENNMLRFKVELLLDMLSASNADFLVMQRELEAAQKAGGQAPRRKR